MKIFRFSQLAAIILTVAFISTARAASPPQMGDMASDFTLNTLNGHAVRLNDLTAKSDVVLVVLRGWPGYQCPFCTAQAHDFIEHAEEFKAAGVQVVMVYPGPADNLSSHATEFLQDKDWPKGFLLLLDPGYAFTQAYGLRWDAPNETAYPSTFVISKTGKITFAYVSHKHGDRVKAEKILGLLSAESQGDGMK
jgi:peroxiredoxin Q/BCP